MKGNHEDTKNSKGHEAFDQKTSRFIAIFVTSWLH